MKKIKLDYGKKGIDIQLPPECPVTILRMRDIPVVENPAMVLKGKIAQPAGAPPFEKLCRDKKTACIVVSDKTRPVPNKIMLPPLLEALDGLSVKTKILIGCGTHSPTEGADLEDILGKEIVRKYEIINHDANNKAELCFLGKTGAGIPIYVNRHYSEAELKITTGLIEPHFMAGFSGGRKAICPGIAGMETIKHFHSPALMESPKSASGILKDNPCHELAEEVAKLADCDFAVNVTINARKEITGIFCGDIKAAFAEGTKFCRSAVSASVPEAQDIVITTNGGYPLDRDFYQTVKGMVNALAITREGGTIIIASECRDGIGSEDYKRQLFNMKDPEDFIREISRPGHFCPDQWEVEEQVKVLRKCKIKLYSSTLTEEEIEKCWCAPVKDLNRAIARTIKEYGSSARITVIPSGPYVLAHLPADLNGSGCQV